MAAAEPPQANSGITQESPANTSAPTTINETPAQAPQRKRPQRPNYALIHAKPLPLDVYPLPAFIPQNPLSLLRIATVILKQFFSPPSSHPANPYIGYFSPETRSIHVTDPVHVRALWEMGFFGKGTLSRSEPSWLEREKARLKASGSGGTSEENTRKRREERKLFKLERARLEREQIEEQLRQEKRLLEISKEEADAGASNPRDSAISHVFPWMQNTSCSEPANTTAPAETKPISQPLKEQETKKVSAPPTSKKVEFANLTVQDSQPQNPIPVSEPEVKQNQEHLQLTLEESFYLSYGLGSLRILSPTSTPISTPELFTLSRTHSHFPPCDVSQLRTDDSFLLNYAVYHYYRSLGWVVRPGVKFSVDYLLYNRGPVFSHAEFGLIIIPEYAEGTEEAARKPKDWWWLHCINRVQSQVKKSLVICYVKVPKDVVVDGEGRVDIGRTLRGYEVREFVVRRWLANRSRD